VHVSPHPPPQIHPGEPVTDAHQQLFEFRRPRIRSHTTLHDKHNGPATPKVTNAPHLTTPQPSTLKNTLLTSSDSELRLEY
jgi:hypothetical protein